MDTINDITSDDFVVVDRDNAATEQARRQIHELILTPNCTIQQFVDLLVKHSADDYLVVLNDLTAKKIEVSIAAKARVVVALWSQQMYAAVDALIKDFLPAEIFKVVQLMDAPRKARSLEKKLARWEKNSKVKPANKQKTVNTIQNLRQEEHSCSFTSAFAKRIKNWAHSIPDSRLDFFLLQFGVGGTEQWRALADVVHFKRQDFQADYFLPMIYGAPAPEGSPIAAYLSINTEGLAETIESHPFLAECYSFIRQKVKKQELTLTDATKAVLARRAPLEDVLWFYEELACPLADAEITTRLTTGEAIEAVRNRSNYSKLMERILTFRQLRAPFVGMLMPYAEERLQSIKMDAADRHECAVLGDCSGSMEIAIKTACIIGSLLSVTLKAELSFFNTYVVNPPVQPKSAEDVLVVSEAIKAWMATSPAAGLWQYYEKKKRIDFFIVVTDEEENTKAHNHYFSTLFKLYREEIYPHAQVIFVSFLKGNTKGQMKESLEAVGITAVQFRLDGIRPDLTKFDELLGVLAVEMERLEKLKG